MLENFTPMFPTAKADTPWRKLSDSGVSALNFEGESILKIEPSAIELLAKTAFHDVSHLMRPGHLAQLRAILDDPEASDNDRFVALDLLRNAQISAEGILPMCQDTGTAIVMGKKGRRVWTTGGDNADEAALSSGIKLTYKNDNHYLCKQCK